MSIFKSKSSQLVRIITVGFVTTIFLLLVAISLRFHSSGVSPLIIPAITIFLTLLTLYMNSLQQIELNDFRLILRKPFGKIVINVKDITSVERLSGSNLTMTWGSQGVFGFYGSTMDNASSFVKDKTKMVGISTGRKKYIISCDNPDKLVSELKTKIKK